MLECHHAGSNHHCGLLLTRQPTFLPHACSQRLSTVSANPEVVASAKATLRREAAEVCGQLFRRQLQALLLGRSLPARRVRLLGATARSVLLDVQGHVLPFVCLGACMPCHFQAQTMVTSAFQTLASLSPSPHMPPCAGARAAQGVQRGAAALPAERAVIPPGRRRAVRPGRGAAGPG